MADRFLFGVAPIDYGPVLLLMPFGFHLAMDTLPSGEPQATASGPPWLVSGFRFRARLGFSIPSSFSGPRGITPAFGYGAPHPSTRGTSTLLNNALLSAHYAVVRLPVSVPVGLMAHRFLPPIRRPAATDGNGVSRFSRMKFLCMHGVCDSAEPRRTRVFARRCVAFRIA